MSEQRFISNDDLDHYKRAMGRYSEARARFEVAEQHWNDEMLYLLQKYDLGQSATINGTTGEIMVDESPEVIP